MKIKVFERFLQHNPPKKPDKITRLSEIFITKINYPFTALIFSVSAGTIWKASPTTP